jgi:hypothetical protein
MSIFSKIFGRKVADQAVTAEALETLTQGKHDSFSLADLAESGLIVAVDMILAKFTPQEQANVMADISSCFTYEYSANSASMRGLHTLIRAMPQDCKTQVLTTTDNLLWLMKHGESDILDEILTLERDDQIKALTACSENNAGSMLKAVLTRHQGSLDKLMDVVRAIDATEGPKVFAASPTLGGALSRCGYGHDVMAHIEEYNTEEKVQALSHANLQRSLGNNGRAPRIG